MTEAVKNRILSDIEEITALIERYGELTAEILTTDIDETLEDIVAGRDEIIEQIAVKHRDIDEACMECTEAEAKQVRKSLKSGNPALGLSPALKEIHKAAVNMKSVYISVQDKEALSRRRVDARVSELRSELENLRDDKKKLDFYSHNKVGENKGGMFDSQL